MIPTVHPVHPRRMPWVSVAHLGVALPQLADFHLGACSLLTPSRFPRRKKKPKRQTRLSPVFEPPKLAAMGRWNHELNHWSAVAGWISSKMRASACHVVSPPEGALPQLFHRRCLCRRCLCWRTSAFSPNEWCSGSAGECLFNRRSCPFLH